MRTGEERPKGFCTKQRWPHTIDVDLKWLDLNSSGKEDQIRWRSMVELGIGQQPITQRGQRREVEIAETAISTFMK